MKKRIITLLLAVLLVVGVFGTVGTTTPEVKAAKGTYMKNLKLNWDLKKGKTMKLTADYPGIGKRNFDVKLTTYELKDAKKDGYKQLTVAFESVRTWALSKEEVDKIVDTCYKKLEKDYVYVPFAAAYAVTDYNTGVSLEGENDYDVKVKTIKSKTSGEKKYAGKKDNWISLPQKAVIKFQVTYPEDYSGLCIGLLGCNSEYGKWVSVSNKGATHSSDMDSLFFDGTKLIKKGKNRYKEDEDGTAIKFGQTSFYMDGKSNSHWIRVKE